MIDPINITDLNKLLKEQGIKPNKTLGQHFLIDETVRDLIIETVAKKRPTSILEVGPGVGGLTIALAHNAKNITVIEKDASIIPTLSSVLKKNTLTNVEIINDDILSYLSTTTTSFDVIIGALPYYLTSRFFRVLLEESLLQWKMGVFIIQKEVADRIIATPPAMSLLTLSVQLFATPSIVEIVPPSSFWPQPDVTSAIIKLEPTDNDSDQNKIILTLARSAFRGKRKQLKNTLSPTLLAAASIDLTARPQHLSLNDWKTLADNV